MPSRNTSTSSASSTRRTRSPSTQKPTGNAKRAQDKAKVLRTLRTMSQKCSLCRSLVGHPDEADILTMHPDLASLEPSHEKRKQHRCTMGSCGASNTGGKWFLGSAGLLKHRITRHTQEMERLQAEGFKAAAERHSDKEKKKPAAGTAEDPICLD